LPKLALLLGVSGSGKTHVTKRLTSKPQVLTVDLIRTDAIHTVCKPEELEGYDIHRWPIWETLLERTDVREGIAAGVKNRCPGFDINRDTLAEGGMLAHAGFRAAFLASLAELGFRSDETKVFWLDPEPDVVLKNVLDRGRKDQKDYRPHKAAHAVNWYRREAENIDCQRVTTAADAVAGIDAFFSRRCVLTK
jgi:hypothetical protein